jgi:hypothetical protein
VCARARPHARGVRRGSNPPKHNVVLHPPPSPNHRPGLASCPLPIGVPRLTLASGLCGGGWVLFDDWSFRVSWTVFLPTYSPFPDVLTLLVTLYFVTSADYRSGSAPLSHSLTLPSLPALGTDKLPPGRRSRRDGISPPLSSTTPCPPRWLSCAYHHPGWPCPWRRPNPETASRTVDRKPLVLPMAGFQRQGRPHCRCDDEGSRPCRASRSHSSPPPPPPPPAVTPRGGLLSPGAGGAPWLRHLGMSGVCRGLMGIHIPRASDTFFLQVWNGRHVTEIDEAWTRRDETTRRPDAG